MAEVAATKVALGEAREVLSGLTHAPQTRRQIGELFEIPKGATFVTFAVDRSELPREDADEREGALLLIIEQSLDGGVTFGNNAEAHDGFGNKGSCVVFNGKHPVGYSLYDTLLANGGTPVPLEQVAEEGQEVRHSWNSQPICPLATHVRFSWEVYRLCRGRIKVFFQ